MRIRFANGYISKTLLATERFEDGYVRSYTIHMLPHLSHYRVILMRRGKMSTLEGFSFEHASSGSTVAVARSVVQDVRTCAANI